MEIKIVPNTDFPYIPTDVLAQSDDAARLEALESDEEYNAAAQKIEELKSAPQEPVVEIPEVIPEPVIIEEPKIEPKESIAEKYGLSEEYIKDGKILGQFDSVEDLLKKYQGREKQAGKQAQELGELRKKVTLVSDLEEKVHTLQSQLEEIQDTSPVKPAELIFDMEITIPKGLTADQANIAHKYAIESAEADLKDRFKREDIPFPKTPEEWDNLATLNSRLYRDAEDIRKSYLKDAILMARDYNSVEENYNSLMETTVRNNTDSLQEMFKQYGYETSLKDTDFVKFANHAFEDMSRMKDPAKRGLYWKSVHGHDILREDALTNYVKNERPDLIQSLSQQEPATEIQVAEGSDTILAQSIGDLVNVEFPKYGIKVDIDDPQTQSKFNAIIEELWSDPKNPLYWDHGKLKPDALSTYIWNNPEERDQIITQALHGVEEKAKTQILTAQEEAKQRLEEEMSQRMAAATRPNPSLATDTTGTQTGDSFSVPPPEIYRNNLEMIKLSKKLGLPSVDDLYDKVDPLIEALPAQEKRKYGDFFTDN